MLHRLLLYQLAYFGHKINKKEIVHLCTVSVSQSIIINYHYNMMGKQKNPQNQLKKITETCFCFLVLFRWCRSSNQINCCTFRPATLLRKENGKQGHKNLKTILHYELFFWLSTSCRDNFAEAKTSLHHETFM